MPPRRSAASQYQSQAHAQRQRGGPSQSQPQGRGAGGRRVRMEEPEESADEDYEDEEHAGGGGDDGAPGDAMDVDQDEEIIRRAQDLVRLALFTEQKRVALRREDITKKVMAASKTRAFAKVFAAAQRILRDVWGMEMVEQPSRAKLDGVVEGDTQSQGPAQTQTQGPSRTQRKSRGGTQAEDEDEDEPEHPKKAMGGKKKAPSTSKTYILRSTLHPTLIAAAAMIDEPLQQKERDYQKDMTDDSPALSQGTLFSWGFPFSEGCVEIEAVGILYTVLALILVGGRGVGDVELHSRLRALQLTAKTPFGGTTIDGFLATCTRQGYLEKRATGEGAPKTGAKRGRISMTQRHNDDDDALNPSIQYEWHWGPRAHAEVGESGIARWVAEFMVGDSDGDDSDLDSEDEAPRLRRGTQGGGRNEPVGPLSRDEKVQKMVVGIEKAAGGRLVEIQST